MKNAKIRRRDLLKKEFMELPDSININEIDFLMEEATKKNKSELIYVNFTINHHNRKYFYYFYHNIIKVLQNNGYHLKIVPGSLPGNFYLHISWDRGFKSITESLLEIKQVKKQLHRIQYPNRSWWERAFGKDPW